MKIQIIGTEEKCNLGILDSKISSFDKPESLDTYDINFIDCSSDEFWKYRGSVTYNVDSNDELNLIKRMIANSKNSKIIVLLPQNTSFRYGNTYFSSIKLSKMLKDFYSILAKITNTPFREIEFEPNRTEIGNKKLESDFYFLGAERQHTKSILSNKATTVSDLSERVYFTSLPITKKEEGYLFLKEIGLCKEKKESEPEWMGGIEMFDDSDQLEKIQIAEQKISAEQELIKQANQKIEQNKRYKSILYTQGDELVEVVFDMVEEMLEVDLSEFVDERKEDIGFKIGDEYFIGEIKGIADNVKAGRLSQLDNHLYHFMEKNGNISEENIRRLLIVNHQRKRPLNDRDPIDNNQINLAINKYGSLIIETSELLKLFEKFRNKEISINEVIKLFQQTGKLTIE